MGDLLKTGSDWLEQQRKSHCSSQVEYCRDVQAWTVDATYGKTDVEMADESGLTIQSLVWDFLITAADLNFEPEAGDVIAANGRKYEVMDLGDMNCWRWSDPYRVTYRIHTKDIGNA